jgi:hypothetical protein
VLPPARGVIPPRPTAEGPRGDGVTNSVLPPSGTRGSRHQKPGARANRNPGLTPPVNTMSPLLGLGEVLGPRRSSLNPGLAPSETRGLRHRAIRSRPDWGWARFLIHGSSSIAIGSRTPTRSRTEMLTRWETVSFSIPAAPQSCTEASQATGGRIDPHGTQRPRSPVTHRRSDPTAPGAPSPAPESFEETAGREANFTNEPNVDENVFLSQVQENDAVVADSAVVPGLDKLQTNPTDDGESGEAGSSRPSDEISNCIPISGR